jgi:hypothetical protein
VELNDFLRQIADFGKWSPTAQIKLFAWYVHVHAGKDRFLPTDIRDCYGSCGMAVPQNIAALLNNLVVGRRPQVLKDSGGFRLERLVREQFDRQYGQRGITVDVHKTLRELPAKLPKLAEQTYLEEALTCFKGNAFRATIVMCWNLAYDHLCTHILNSRLADFNTKATAMSIKKTVASREDFYDLMESRVLEICRAAGITDKNVHGILEEKLKTRNRAAHASGSTFLQPQAESYILDLVNNAVLKL